MALITADLLAQRYETLKSYALHVRQRTSSFIAELAAGPVESVTVIQEYQNLGAARDRLNQAAALSGIGAYAQAAEDDPTYDVVAEIGVVVTAIEAALTWVDSNFPASGGYILFAQIDDGAVTNRSFTEAQTAGLRTALQAVVTAIGT